jgi:hypothetical protein
MTFTPEQRDDIGLALQNFPRVISVNIEPADEAQIVVQIEAPQTVARNAVARVAERFDFVVVDDGEYTDDVYHVVIARSGVANDPSNRPLIAITIPPKPHYRFTHREFPSAVAFISGVGSRAADDDERQITLQLVTSHHDLADASFDALVATLKAAGWTAIAEEN